jgi:hypothetical protein
MDIKSFTDNEYTVAIVMIVAIAYASLARPTLPSWLTKLFKNDIFRVVFLSLLLMFNFEKSPHVALTVALVFVVTLHYINENDVQEQFGLLETFKANLNNKQH